MTEVSDGANVLLQHVHELHSQDAIDIEEKQRLQDEVNAIEDDLEAHYESLATENNQ
jgi:hypothetical protein